MLIEKEAIKRVGEAWRLLRPGGRIVIFDKFLPENGELTRRRRALGLVLSAIGTDPNRRLSDIITGFSGLVIKQHEPSLFRGQYRLLHIEKTDLACVPQKESMALLKGRRK